MDKNSKQIIETYKSVEIPEIDFESQITSKIRMSKNKKPVFRIKTALLVCLVLVVTSTVVFALSKVIHNEDGSHTLISETDDKSWTIQANRFDSELNASEKKMHNKLMDEILELSVVGDQAKVGYLKYSEEHEEIFHVIAATDNYDFDDETMTELKENKSTPNYLSDVLTKLQEDFGIDDIEYFYLVDDATHEIIKAECVEKSIFGEVYTDIVPVERDLHSVRLDLLSTNMDKFLNTTIFLSDKNLDVGMSAPEIDYETVMIDERLGMLSKRIGRQYNLVTEVNGIGISIITDPRGNPDHMIELAKKLIEVLENY